ncbi:MAG: potassium/proton antiporter [Phycisphaeraceae bacterium]|nr:potassium/proton antiporter [Phycisphaeraceae bacterium]
MPSLSLAITEPMATGLLLLVFGLLIAFSVLFTRALDRMGIPVVLLFLVLGMLGGSEGLGGIVFDDYELAFRFGTIALVLILFDGGLNTAHSSIRRSLAPASLLATAGVLGTAGMVAVLARLMGLSWAQALLIGAIVSSTDAAAVFAVLRGGSLRVKEPVRSTLELESCVNDPMAVILTMTVVSTLGPALGGGLTWHLALTVPLQLLIGAVVGVGIGIGGRWLLNRAILSTTGLYPVATLAIAFLSFGVATVSYGSGFLSVFATAAVLGNGPLPYKMGLTRVHDAIAWFAQVSMFLMLGLLVFPSRLLDVAGVGLMLGLLLAVVARPMVAAACLLPFRWPLRHVLFTSWVGIRGAVPIVLATIPIMAGIPGGDRVFDIVFFIVVVSALVPGASIVPLTRMLRLETRTPPPPAAMLEMHSLRRLNGDIHIYRIHETVAVSGAHLREIEFPEGVSVLLVIRGDTLIPARGSTRLAPGDFVYVFCAHGDEGRVGLLFGENIEA